MSANQPADAITMQAAYYDSTGPAREVLRLGELPDPEPGAGEVRVRVYTSGVNPSDVKTRAGLRSKTLPFARIVPHSDGAGVIDRVGAGVPPRGAGQPQRPYPPDRQGRVRPIR